MACENKIVCYAFPIEWCSSFRFQNHERSKKHLKNVERLREQMLEEDEQFDMTDTEAGVNDEMDDLVQTLDETVLDIPTDGKDKNDEEMCHGTEDTRYESDVNEKEGTRDYDANEKESTRDSDVNDGKESTRDYDVNEGKEGTRDSDVNDGKEGTSDSEACRYDRQRHGLDPGSDSDQTPCDHLTQQPLTNKENETKEPEEKEKKKKGNKSRRKREKKKTMSTEAAVWVCHVCSESFPTRNQLFKHINETGHALAIPGAGSPSGVKKTKKRK